MNDDPAVTLQQFSKLVDMLQRLVEAGAESARRIEVLEQTALKQNKLNSDMASLIQRLVDKIDPREESSLIM